MGKILNKMVERNFNDYPARIALTDYCNLRCFFCSNEGMDLKNKNNCHADLNKLVYLLKAMKKGGFSKLSLTGGEPSIYPKVGELLTAVNDMGFSQTFFHTNGVSLKKPLSDQLLDKFTKIAVSVHSVNRKIWKSLTNGTDYQFNKVIKNLDYLASLSSKSKTKIEIKAVMMKGIVDSKENLRELLDFCSSRKFSFKLLNFEPITKDQEKYQLPLGNVIKTLVEIGSVPLNPDKQFRGQESYLPLNRFQYKNINGVVIEIGCGQLDVCSACHLSNEVFIDPSLKIKPCHATKFNIPLSELIDKQDQDGILKAISKSRDYLQESPGAGLSHWYNNENS
ncbi:MAG: radical SAM protein [Patescibacteria group bacterium]